MKKKIVTGSLLAICMLVILPSVSAIEFNVALKEKKACILEENFRMSVKELIDEGKIGDIIKFIIMWILSGTIGRLLSWIRIILFILGIFDFPVTPPN